MRGGQVFTIPVSNGIFGHRKRIGAAIWVFLWLIDGTTNEVSTADGKVEGLVRGGHPVALSEIAADLEKMSPDAVYEQLARLTEAGYIRKIVHGNGRPNGYAVVNSKRFWNRRTKARRSELSTVVQKPDGTAEVPSGFSRQPSYISRQPSYKSPSVDKTRARAVQEITRHNNSDLEPITPEMVATGVLQTLGLSGRDLLVILVDVCRSELKRSETPNSLRDSLVSAWTDFSRAKEDGKLTKYATGAPRFFGEGIWKDRGSWPWKAGYSLPPIPGTGPPDANALIRAEREELAKHPEREQAPAYLTGKI